MKMSMHSVVLHTKLITNKVLILVLSFPWIGLYSVKDGKSPSREQGILSKVQDFKNRFSFEQSSQDSPYDFLKIGAHDSALIKASCKPHYLRVYYST